MRIKSKKTKTLIKAFEARENAQLVIGILYWGADKTGLYTDGKEIC